MWTWSPPGSDGHPGVLDEALLWLSARCISTAWSPSSKSQRRGKHLYCRWSPNYVNGLPPAAGSLNLLESPAHDALGLLEGANTGAWLKLGTLGTQVLCLSWHVVHHVFHSVSQNSLYVHIWGVWIYVRLCFCLHMGKGVHVYINLVVPIWQSVQIPSMTALSCCCPMSHF